MADLFDIVVARKLSGGGGGGGSSDFSIAHVTITETIEGAVSNVQGPHISMETMIDPPVECIGYGLFDATSPADIDVVLYKGKAVLFVGDISSVKTTVTSGNAEVFTFSDEWGTYAEVLVMGDCTITLSNPT